MTLLLQRKFVIFSIGKCGLQKENNCPQTRILLSFYKGRQHCVLKGT